MQEPINFITAVSAQEQKTIAAWYKVSIGIFTIIVLCIAALHITQLQRLLAVREQQHGLQLPKNSQRLVDQYQTLLQQEALLKKQIEVVTTMSKQQNNPVSYIQAIKAALSGTTTIEICSIKKDNITLEFVCSHPRKAMTFVQQLSEEGHFTALKISSLQPLQGSNDHCRARVHGKLKQI